MRWRSASTVSVAVAVAVAVGCGSQAEHAAVSLSDGQTRWFLPGQLETGETIGCVLEGHRVVTKVPASTGISSGTEMF